MGILVLDREATTVTTTLDVGRNDPCPCGSGKKFKKCCLGRGGNGRGHGPSLSVRATPETRRAAASGVWQADLVPFPASFTDDPSARPATVHVVAGGFVLATEMLGRAPSEPDEIAALLEGAVRSVAGETDVWPDTIEVRHAELGDALGPRLAAEGVRVVSRRHLDELDELAIRLARDVGGWRWDALPTSMPDTWAGWGLPLAQVADLFAAVAEFRRAEPWVRLPNERLLTVEMPEGREWAASVLGYAGQEYGFALYASADDFASLLESPDPVEAFAAFEGRVLSVTLEPRSALPRPMQREVASAGWEVADPDAYPLLMATHTPGGGVSRRDAAELTAALRAVASLARAEPRKLSRGERAEWRDAGAGVRVVHHEGAAGGFADPSSLWDTPEELSPSGPEGPGARPETAFNVPEGERVIEALAGTLAWEIWCESEPDDASDPASDPAPADSAPGPAPIQLSLDTGDVEDDDVWGDGGVSRTGGASRDAGASRETDREGEPDESIDSADAELELIDTATFVTVDRFFEWLYYERDLALDTARKHARNASVFVSYLFSVAQAPLAGVTEYDLRRFLFEWYPRKVRDAKYRADAMPVSLGHFFRWLAREEGVECPWARGVLDERDEYATRYDAFPGGFWWDDDVGEWSAELWQDLDRRVLLCDPGLGESSQWGEDTPLGRTMGMIEAGLERELQRRWLVWRDEEIEAGSREPDVLRAALVRRQRAWEAEPHPDLDGLSPAAAIAREREDEGPAP